jgi:hypothetical protein
MFTKPFVLAIQLSIAADASWTCRGLIPLL